jgi:hypothetical protein
MALADEVFTHFPFMHVSAPMYYVALMTFILIFSSVTMVAVDAGHQMKKIVLLYVFNHYWWRDLWGHKLGNGKILLKVSMGLLKQRR